jgi:hypothetical protein
VKLVSVFILLALPGSIPRKQRVLHRFASRSSAFLFSYRMRHERTSSKTSQCDEMKASHNE